MEIPRNTSLVEYYRMLRQLEHPANSLKSFLSEITAKSPNTVTNWCSGKYPDTLTQRVIAKAMNSTPEELFPKLSD